MTMPPVEACSDRQDRHCRDDRRNIVVRAWPVRYASPRTTTKPVCLGCANGERNGPPEYHLGASLSVQATTERESSPRPRKCGPAYQPTKLSTRKAPHRASQARSRSKVTPPPTAVARPVMPVASVANCLCSIGSRKPSTGFY